MVSTKNLPGYYYSGDAKFEGENRDLSANIPYYIGVTSEEELTAEIINSDGVVIRNIETEAVKGFNKLSWRFDMEFWCCGKIGKNWEFVKGKI